MKKFLKSTHHWSSTLIGVKVKLKGGKITPIHSTGVNKYCLWWVLGN